MSRRAVLLGAAALVALPGAAAAQVRLDAQAAWLTRQDGGARWSGAGGGARLEVRGGRWRLVGSYVAGLVSAAAAPNAATGPVTLAMAGVAAGFRLRPQLWLEAGATSEQASPVLAARDVGGVWIGARVEGGVGAGMRAWVDAAAYPVASANSGAAPGASAVPYGVGFGASLALGPRLLFRAGYALRRLDRFTVQSSAACIGLGLIL